MNSETLDSSIINWINTFELKNPVHSIEELYDGVVFNEILNDINPSWFKKLQPNEGENTQNWVVIFNRLKKIYSLVSGFYAEELGQSIIKVESPNFNSISKNKDTVEILKFAQLILVLAVQSEKNKEYISKITSLNQANQQWIMISIEEIMDKLSKVNETSESGEDSIRMLKAERDELYENKKELSNKLQHLQRENMRINEQKRILEDRIRDFETQLEAVDELGKADSLLKNEISSLKNQLGLSEDKCQEMELLNEQKQKTIDNLEKRLVEISKQAEEAGYLKDKMDEYDHMKIRLNASEEVVAKYKRKLEDNQVLLEQYKNLEKESKEQSENLQHLEEEQVKYNNLKQMAKGYKETIAALEAKNRELFNELKLVQNQTIEGEKKIERLEEQNAQSIDLIQELQEKLNNMDNDNGEFNLETQLNDTKEIELKMEIADITQLKNKFENDYMQVYQENLKLKGELNQIANRDSQTSADSKMIIDEYVNEINVLQYKLKNYENAIEIERAGGDITTSRAFFDLQKENKDLNIRMKGIMDENAQQQDEIANLKKEIEQLKISEADLKKQNENQMSINKNLNQILTSLDNKDMNDMSRKLAMISSKYYVSNEKVSELQKTLSIARNYITTLDEKVKKKNANEIKMKEKLEHEILILESEIKSQKEIYERELRMMNFAWYDMVVRTTQARFDISRNNEKISFLNRERRNLENNILKYRSMD